MKAAARSKSAVFESRLIECVQVWRIKLKPAQKTEVVGDLCLKSCVCSFFVFNKVSCLFPSQSLWCLTVFPPSGMRRLHGVCAESMCCLCCVTACSLDCYCLNSGKAAFVFVTLQLSSLVLKSNWTLFSGTCWAFIEVLTELVWWRADPRRSCRWRDSNSLYPLAGFCV